MGNHEREVCIDKGVVGGGAGNRKPQAGEAARFPAADLPPCAVEGFMVVKPR